MISSTAIACAICATAPVQIDFESSLQIHAHKIKMSPQERDRIFREIQFAIKKMNICMDNADREASKITNIDIRQTTKAVIQGAICGLGGRYPYAVVIGGCLGTLSHVGDEAYDHFVKSKDHVKDAEYYAYEADRLQEKLWMDDEED
jgi:hypothetical protein